MANSLAWIRAYVLPDLMFQDFESGVLPGGWTTAIGSPNYGYTPAIMGSFSLGIAGTSTVCFGSFQNNSDVSLYFKFMMSALPLTEAVMVSLFRTAVTGPQLRVYCEASGALQVVDSTEAHVSATVSNVSTNTIYNVWVHYTAGTGSNAVCSVAFSTDELEPTSGNQFASVASANSTQSVGSVSFNGGRILTVLDHVGVATFDMPTGW